MKFRISRSQLDKESKPCNSAVKEKFTYIDIRTVSKPEDIPANKGKSKWWYEEGTNHRLINNEIARDFEREDWFVEILTLEKLMNFIKDIDSEIVINKKAESILICCENS